MLLAQVGSRMEETIGGVRVWRLSPRMCVRSPSPPPMGGKMARDKTPDAKRRGVRESSPEKSMKTERSAAQPAAEKIDLASHSVAVLAYVRVL